MGLSIILMQQYEGLQTVRFACPSGPGFHDTSAKKAEPGEQEFSFLKKDGHPLGATPD